MFLRRGISYTDTVMFSLSGVVPVLDNQETLLELHTRLTATCSATVPDAYELIFVNDGSIDRPGEDLSHIASTEPQVRAISLRRNFGSQAAILAGLAHATSHRVAMIAADFQEPPELISDLYIACGAGTEIALASRSTFLPASFKTKSVCANWRVDNGHSNIPRYVCAHFITLMRYVPESPPPD